MNGRRKTSTLGIPVGLGHAQGRDREDTDMRIRTCRRSRRPICGLPEPAKRQTRYRLASRHLEYQWIVGTERATRPEVAIASSGSPVWDTMEARG